MIHYRKNKNNREFYKAIETTGITVRVLNKESFSRIDVSYNKLIYGDAFDEWTTACTEQEFNDAKSIATTRIGLERIEL